jgi:erythronate-4-phosphate dehydrogenase
MIRIVADDKIPFLRGALESFANVTYMPGRQINRDALEHADAILIRTRTKCNAELLEGTPVKFIASATIGFDHIDTVYCEEKNIRWTNAPGCNSTSVQQYIASALSRIASDSNFDLKERTLGIIGVGNVGSKVERLARILGMNVLLNDPPRERKENGNVFVSLEKILRESDIITLHVPLNMDGEDKTLHMFDNETFKKIRKGCWLINSSRGEVIDTDALKDAISDEILSGLVIDVWEKEPEIDIPLMHMAYLATPHVAGYSTDGKANGTSMIVRAIGEWFNIPTNGWFPSDIPGPADPVVSIDNSDKSDEEIIRKAVLHTYNIMEDDVKLRFDPSRFEKIREEYPVRREFQAYSVRLKSGSAILAKMLSEIGFRLEH